MALSKTQKELQSRYPLLSSREHTEASGLRYSSYRSLVMYFLGYSRHFGQRDMLSKTEFEELYNRYENLVRLKAELNK